VDADWLSSNWGLAVAAVLFIPVFIAAARGLYGRTANAQLRARLGTLRHARAEYNKAVRREDRLKDRVSTLERRADVVIPRVLQDTHEKLEDASALKKIAHDQLLVAANHVRRVILEEYPPAKQARLRARYLPEDDAVEKRPFTF